MEEMFYREGGETLEQIAQRSSGCPITGSVQSRVEWGFDQLGLVEGDPAHDRGIGLDDLYSNPNHSKII